MREAICRPTIQRENTIEAVTLREYIEQNGNMKMDDALLRFVPIMKTLQHMHKKDSTHGDISPDNLRVLGDGSLKLSDADSVEQYEDMTLTRLVDGSCYSPPEKLDIKGVLGSWSDVYSICAVMYFCITGKDPDSVVSRLLLDNLKRPSDLNADISPNEEKTLMRGLSLDSKERIHDMVQLRQLIMIK